MLYDILTGSGGAAKIALPPVTNGKDSAMIDVSIDFARCDANGTCAALMPDVFAIGDDGLLEQLENIVADDRADDLDEVVLCCPMGAISRS